MNEYPLHKHPAGKPAATHSRSRGVTGLRFLSGPSALRAALGLFLCSAFLRAFGTERNGSTFTPGSLGDFGIAVVSTNAGLHNLPLSSSRNLVLTAKWLHEFHTQDRFQGDYLYACMGFRL